jgi:hypothetical protein
MPHLKTVNKAIQEKYPFLKLVKGNGYFYFHSDDEFYGNLLCSLYTTSVGVCRISHLSLERWLEEADEIYEQIKNDIPPQIEKTSYFWEAKDAGGNRYTRGREFCTDEEALEWADSFRSGYKDFKVWKKIG